MLYKYIDYEGFIEGDEVYKVYTEDSVVQETSHFKDNQYDYAGIYFKILANIMYLEGNLEKNREEIAYLYYLLAYHVGLFYHPVESRHVSLHYLDKAKDLTSSYALLDKISVVEMMIKEEI